MSDNLFERRQAERRYALKFLDYEVLSSKGEVTGRGLARTLNVSETGLRLETGQFFDPEQMLRITLGLENDLVQINGRVSPGNQVGGLANILEKSLGSSMKGGTGPLMEVYHYAEPVTAKGLVFMDTPGYDPVSVTGMVAGGAIGNGFDRMFRELPSGGTAVVDFIRVNYPWGGSWPTFNVADALVAAGVVLLLLAGLRRRPPQGEVPENVTV